MRVLMVGATGRHRLAQPYSLSAKFCSVDYRDVAEVAARAMTGGDASELSHGTFELSAPGMEDSHQTAAIISEVLGRTITAVQIPLDQFASQLPEGPFCDGMSCSGRSLAGNPGR